MVRLVPYDLSCHFVRHSGFPTSQEEGMPKAVEGLLLALLYAHETFPSVSDNHVWSGDAKSWWRVFLQVWEKPLLPSPLPIFIVFQESERYKLRTQGN